MFELTGVEAKDVKLLVNKVSKGFMVGQFVELYVYQENQTRFRPADPERMQKKNEKQAAERQAVISTPGHREFYLSKYDFNDCERAIFKYLITHNSNKWEKGKHLRYYFTRDMYERIGYDSVESMFGRMSKSYYCSIQNDLFCNKEVAFRIDNFCREKAREGSDTHGDLFSSDVAAYLAHDAHDNFATGRLEGVCKSPLKAAVKIVTPPDAVTPAASTLEDAFYVDKTDIVNAALDII